jgi:uncharacterized membrane protein YfcA
MKSIAIKPIHWYGLIVVSAALVWVEGIKSLVSIIPALLLVLSFSFIGMWARKQSDRLFTDCRIAGMVSAVALVSLVLTIVLKSFLSRDSIEGWLVITLLLILMIQFFFKYRKVSRQLAERQRLI